MINFDVFEIDLCGNTAPHIVAVNCIVVAQSLL